MQLTGAGSLPPAEHIAGAVTTAAERLGHRPAITVLRADRRDEQGFASLRKWTAKGAHLLDLEALLEPGDRLRLHAPASWIATAVCLSAWWLGVEVSLDGDAPVSVSHETLHAPAAGRSAYVIGDAPDGGPVGDVDDEPWSVAVQAFPDQPPEPRSAPDLAAAHAGHDAWTQRALLEAAGRWGEDGALGIESDAVPSVWLPAVLRPFVTGQATVILAGGEHATADDEGVALWA